MLLKEAFGHLAGALVARRVRELLVATKYDDGGPVPIRGELVALETNQRVRSHPFDFATERGVPIQELAVQIDPQRDNVRLVVPSTRQADYVVPCQHPPAFLRRHLLYQHYKIAHLNKVRVFQRGSVLNLHDPVSTERVRLNSRHGRCRIRAIPSSHVREWVLDLLSNVGCRTDIAAGEYAAAT
jgi:hypothetical protein